MCDRGSPADHVSSQPPAGKALSTLVRGTGVVSSLTLLSRVLGFVRDLLVARLFGASPIADAFFVAYRIPNLLRSFVAEGALTSAFVPVLTEERRHDQERARDTVRAVVGLLLVTTLLLALLGMVFAPVLVNLFAPGFSGDSDKASLCAVLTRLMMPYVIFVSLVAMLNGALNTVNVFGASAWAQVWMNVTLIAGALVAGYFEPRYGVVTLAVSVLLGGLVQVLSQVPAARRAGFSLVPARVMWTPATRQVVILMVPAVIGATVYQLQIFMNTVLASSLAQGSVSWLYYADRLVQLPIGIFTVALASVLLPALSRAASDRDQSAFSKGLEDSLRYVSLVIMPVSAAIYIFAEPLIYLLFERGAFGRSETIQTAHAVRYYSIGLWAVSCHSMLVRGLIARKDTKTPTLIGVITLVATLFFSLAFMGPPVSLESGRLYDFLSLAQRAISQIVPAFTLGHAGLALASSSAAFVSMLIALCILQRRERVSMRGFVKTTLGALGGVILMCVSVEVCAVKSWTYHLQLLCGLPLVVVVYIVGLWLAQTQELRRVAEFMRSQTIRIRR